MKFVRNRILKNTGIDFDYVQLSAINNVERYMLNEPYNEKAIYNDIDIVKQCYSINPYKIMYFDDLFLIFLNKKVEEVERFNNILLNPNNNYFYQELLQYSNLPLRFSKNPEIDAKILITFCGLSEDYYHTILFALSDPKIADTKEYIDKIHGFIAYEGISYEGFGKNSKIGWYEKYPDTDVEIINQFNIVKDEYDKSKVITNNKVIGNYAELECFNFLRQVLNPNEELIWVSRYIGDGFGYDEMIHNKLTNEVKLYEIKGSLSLNQENIIGLTRPETVTLQIAKEKNIEHHSVKLFFDKDMTRIYDVCNKDGQISLNQTNGRMLGYINESLNEDERKLTYKLF